MNDSKCDALGGAIYVIGALPHGRSFILGAEFHPNPCIGALPDG
jgi:hypothetical protein